MPDAPLPGTPVLAPLGASPSEASRPDTPLEDGRYHVYESNPAPWWLAVIWAAYLIFGVTYLIVNLIQ
jgi:hypothetical protein